MKQEMIQKMMNIFLVLVHNDIVLLAATSIWIRKLKIQEPVDDTRYDMKVEDQRLKTMINKIRI